MQSRQKGRACFGAGGRAWRATQWAAAAAATTSSSQRLRRRTSVPGGPEHDGGGDGGVGPVAVVPHPSGQQRQPRRKGVHAAGGQGAGVGRCGSACAFASLRCANRSSTRLQQQQFQPATQPNHSDRRPPGPQTHAPQVHQRLHRLRPLEHKLGQGRLAGGGAGDHGREPGRGAQTGAAGTGGQGFGTGWTAAGLAAGQWPPAERRLQRCPSAAPAACPVNRATYIF